MTTVTKESEKIAMNEKDINSVIIVCVSSKICERIKSVS